MDRSNNLRKRKSEIIDGGFIKLEKIIGKLKKLIKTGPVNLLTRLFIIKVVQCLKSTTK